MPYNFDALIDRRNSDSIKYTLFHDKPDVLPLWVADMDFVSPSPVIEALQKRVAHEVFGYAFDNLPLREIFSGTHGASLWLEN